MNSNSNIILFDGVCNFCNFWVNFIMKRDVKKKFKFASLQSEAGIRLSEKYSVKKEDIDSVILIEDDKYFIKSEAVLKIVKELTLSWRMLHCLKIFPLFLRNFVYDVLAKNRYILFGKKDSCRIPTEEEKSRFIG